MKWTAKSEFLKPETKIYFYVNTPTDVTMIRFIPQKKDLRKHFESYWG